ncbi:MAG: hypothetical protein ACO1SV_03960 [Fimbriimonas sp.]
MSDLPPPSEKWHRWLARDCDYLLAAVLGALAIVLAFRQVQSQGVSADPAMTLGMAALPIGCLLARPSLVSMLALVVVGFPCFVSATMYCDVSHNGATPLLHAVEDYLLYVPAYGLLRALHLGLTKP